MLLPRALPLRRYRDIASLLWRHRKLDRDRGASIDAKAKELTDALEQMGPTFIKLGQVLSTRPDLVPAAYVTALQRLQDRVTPFDTDTLETIVSVELGGARLSKAFSRFDPRPIAAASLGQVHRAALRDGRDVVVKVQRPGIQKRVADDLATLEPIASFFDKHTLAGRTYEFGLMLEEFKVSLLRELDYLCEAKNLRALHDNLSAFPHIVVPRPIDDYTTSRVLTMEFIAGSKITALSPVVLTEIDGMTLASEVFRAWLKQILVDGMFHADPHPGNILLTNDGRIALLDVGMVAYLSPSWRDGLFRLLLSLAEGRSDEVADVCVELSEAHEDFDERVFRKKVAQIVARQQNASAEEVEVGRLVVEISQAATASGIRVPSELTMLGKTLLNLDAIARALAPAFQPNQAVREHARELMQQRLSQQVSSAHVFQKALEVNELVQRLPTRVNRLMESLSHNRLKVKVDVIDETVLIDGMQKVANRITTGLILAALILASTMMMKIETRFTLFGYPGIAIVLFLVSALLGLFLVVNVVWKDRKR